MSGGIVVRDGEEVAVSAGGARRGRRDNGLDAAEYAAAGDVDPRVGEHLLDVLGAGGIAAYLQPAVDLNPVTRSTTVPARPTDRLYVDRAHLSTARQYLSRLAADSWGTPAASPDAPDVDAAWASIVASYEAEVDEGSRPWPAAEHIDVREPGTGAGERAPGEPGGPGERGAGEPRDPGERGAGEPRAGDVAASRLVDGRNAIEPSLLDGLDTFGADLDDGDDEEGYTPPPPPPLPRISKYAVLGVLGIVGGFVVFLFPELLPIDRDIAMLLGFSGILAGFVTLIWRLRPGDDEDDYDPDDGAKV